ncbi:disease resistance protein TAO1-like [Cryptomeria japonica]|uniref:disease resistance protein TAO1-like n=1 Tax=Cryptomeria japonica TaxID=3369 RepID=UPI0027DA9EC6|nr:disease resistance protein TAO1-like [Cryptomeria japonica]
MFCLFHISRKHELPSCPPPFREYMEMMRISNVRVGLELLLIKYNDFSQEFQQLSRGLLWFRCSNFEHRYIPSWLSLDNIRVLELTSPESLETLWEEAHPPLQLRELLIKYASILQSLPRSIGHLKHLKRLSLVDTGMVPLSSLPEEFCLLHSLEHLSLEACPELSRLSNHFGDLVNVRHLNLLFCRSLEMLPVSFKKLINLEYLKLSYCQKLTLKSDILENITKLEIFDVLHCYKFKKLPHNITKQSFLRKLYISNTKSLIELPVYTGQLTKLDELKIVECPLLTRLPTSLGKLPTVI